MIIIFRDEIFNITMVGQLRWHGPPLSEGDSSPPYFVEDGVFLPKRIKEISFILDYFLFNY